MSIFPVQLTTSRIGNLTRLILSLAKCDGDSYMHTSSVDRNRNICINTLECDLLHIELHTIKIPPAEILKIHQLAKTAALVSDNITRRFTKISALFVSDTLLVVRNTSLRPFRPAGFKLNNFNFRSVKQMYQLYVNKEVVLPYVPTTDSTLVFSEATVLLLLSYIWPYSTEIQLFYQAPLCVLFRVRVCILSTSATCFLYYLTLSARKIATLTT